MKKDLYRFSLIVSLVVVGVAAVAACGRDGDVSTAKVRSLQPVSSSTTVLPQTIVSPDDADLEVGDAVAKIRDLVERYPTSEEDLKSWQHGLGTLEGTTEAQGFVDLQGMMDNSDIVVAGRITSMQKREYSNPDSGDTPDAPGTLVAAQYVVEVVAVAPRGAAAPRHVMFEFLAQLGTPPPRGAVVLFLHRRDDISTAETPVYRPVSSQGIVVLDEAGGMQFPMNTAAELPASIKTSTTADILRQIFG